MNSESWHRRYITRKLDLSSAQMFITVAAYQLLHTTLENQVAKWAYLRKLLRLFQDKFIEDPGEDGPARRQTLGGTLKKTQSKAESMKVQKRFYKKVLHTLLKLLSMRMVNSVIGTKYRRTLNSVLRRATT